LAEAEFGEELLDGRVEGEEHGGDFDGGVSAAELSEREGSGDGDLLSEDVHFVLDFRGDAAVGLEFAEFVEGAVGAAFELRGDLDDAVEGAEEGFGVGFVCEAGEGVDFKGAGAAGLEEVEGIALEGFEFGGAIGEALGEELLAEGFKAGVLIGVGGEEGGGLGLEAVFGGVSGGFGFALGGAGAGGFLGVESIGEAVLHGGLTFSRDRGRASMERSSTGGGGHRGGEAPKWLRGGEIFF
jgi:hypothetical protein